MDIIEKEYKLSSDIEKYPTKMVIKHDLEPVHRRCISGEEALSVTLTIAGNEYSKQDVKEKITEIFHTLIEEYGDNAIIDSYEIELSAKLNAYIDLIKENLNFTQWKIIRCKIDALFSNNAYKDDFIL